MRLSVVFLLGVLVVHGEAFNSFSIFLKNIICNEKKSARNTVKDYLLCRYDRNIAPSHNATTRVSLKMILKYFTYNMHESTISIHSWLSMSWFDTNLSWDLQSPNKDVTHLHLPSDDIWVPDLSIHNGADSSSTDSFNPVSCLIYNSGQVMCMPSIRNDALCSPNLAKFPFDVQNCTLAVGSLVHGEESVTFNLADSAISLEEFEENGEWKLKKVWASEQTGHYFGGKHKFPLVNFHFLIERQSGAQICMVVVPALVMIIITLTVLCLSPDETERIILICTNSVIHSLYLHYLAWQIPVNGLGVPLLLSFGKDSLLLSNFTLVLTVLQRRLIRTKAECPVWLSKLAVGLATNRFGATVFPFEKDFKQIGNPVEENGELVERFKSIEFLTISRLLDRLCLIVYSIVYLTMFTAFIL